MWADLTKVHSNQDKYGRNQDHYSRMHICKNYCHLCLYAIDHSHYEINTYLEYESLIKDYFLSMSLIFSYKFSFEPVQNSHDH